jgi:hypothetical protein
MTRIFSLGLLILGLSVSCAKKIQFQEPDIPPGTLVLEFVSPVRYVLDLKIDGRDIPVQYKRKNRTLWVQGLTPGFHDFNLHSISYVFGPEYGRFEILKDRGAYFFIQSRRYRSASPKDKKQVSIRAYRKALKDENTSVTSAKGISATFSSESPEPLRQEQPPAADN